MVHPLPLHSGQANLSSITWTRPLSQNGFVHGLRDRFRRSARRCRRRSFSGRFGVLRATSSTPYFCFSSQIATILFFDVMTFFPPGASALVSSAVVVPFSTRTVR